MPKDHSASSFKNITHDDYNEDEPDVMTGMCIQETNKPMHAINQTCKKTNYIYKVNKNLSLKTSPRGVTPKTF